MDETTRAGHPETAELQAHADGEPQDDRVARHMESCAMCREEVAAVRRVNAALALGSKPSDSLLARIQAKRAGAASALPRASRARPRLRAFAVPVGLAAAALLVFAPRVFRDDRTLEVPATVGAKRALPGSVFETLLTEWTMLPLDSVVRSADGRGMTVKLRYAAGFSESGEAEQLAARIREYLTEQGIDPAAIEVSREATQLSTRRIPAGAVHITVRRPAVP